MEQQDEAPSESWGDQVVREFRAEWTRFTEAMSEFGAQLRNAIDDINAMVIQQHEAAGAPGGHGLQPTWDWHTGRVTGATLREAEYRRTVRQWAIDEFAHHIKTGQHLPVPVREDAGV